MLNGSSNLGIRRALARANFALLCAVFLWVYARGQVQRLPAGDDAELWLAIRGGACFLAVLMALACVGAAIGTAVADKTANRFEMMAWCAVSLIVVPGTAVGIAMLLASG
jgi:hypothetical protein